MNHSTDLPEVIANSGRSSSIPQSALLREVGNVGLNETLFKVETMKKHIESVKLTREVDQNADLSYLGEYSNLDDGNAIDRQERGDIGRGEYRYFNPAMTGEETGNPNSPEEDYARAEDYNRGGWCMTGVYAVAEVVIGGTIQRIRSGGLWGVESDSDNEYFAEIGREQLSELAEQLAALGFSRKAINAAIPTDVEFSDF
jgi:hypothetical protein